MKSAILSTLFLCIWKLSLVSACATKQQIQHGPVPSMMGFFPINKKVPFAKRGNDKLQILRQNFTINQNGSSGENSCLWGKLRNIPVLVTGNIYGENLLGKI